MATATRLRADDEIKKARTRALTYLRREATANRQRALDEAAEAIKRARTVTDASSPSAALAGVILDHAVDVTTPVLAGLGLTPPMDVTTTNDSRARAHTDYERIFVAMPLGDFPKDYPPPADVKRLVSITKGLIYHEAGHLLYSIPFEHLSRSAAQLGSPMPREFTNTKFHNGIGRFAWVQNVLEDQRMECAMVRLSPVFENHFRVTAAYMILQPSISRGRAAMMWPYLCGRTYLPKDLLSTLRADALAQATSLGLREVFYAIEDGVRSYKRAVTDRELFEAVVATTDAFMKWFDEPEDMRVSTIDTHRDPGNDANGATRRSLTESATDDRANDDDASGTPSTTPSTGVASAQQLRDLVAATAKESVDKSVSQTQVNDMITTLNVALGRGLARDLTTSPMTPDQKNAAHQVKAGMLDVLEPLMTRVEPGWTFRLEDGVLDPVTFSLRSPGDTDYWSNVEDEAQPGHDFAVSLVLDVSYSMSEQVTELSVAAIGVRLACEQLGIPCTVTSFADSASLVVDAFDPTEEVTVSCQGGTQPLEALEDLHNQRHGKAGHLVVVFTDGEWAGVPSMGPFREPGATYLGVSLGEAARQTLLGRHFDSVASIDRARDLVMPVQHLLVDLVS